MREREREEEDETERERNTHTKADNNFKVALIFILFSPLVFK